MAFKNWLKEKLVELDNQEDLELLQGVDYVGTYLDIIEKVYNLYESVGMMDVEEIKIFHISNPLKYSYYFVIEHGCVFDLDNVFETIREFNRYEFSTGIDFECFTKAILQGQFNEDDKLSNKKFYFLASLNPADYIKEYIDRVEVVANKNLISYGTVEDLYNQFITLLAIDSEFSLLFKSTIQSFGILVFNTKEDLEQYKEFRAETRILHVISAKPEDLPEEIQEAIKMVINSKINRDDDEEDYIENLTVGNPDTILS